MGRLVAETTTELLERLAPDPDDVLAEMAARARETGFPTVGPEVGAFLRFCARTAGTTRAFEFGSGYGYSAYWVAPALPPDGTLVLTEHDPDELDAARDYLARGGYADRAVFEAGDALDAVDRHEGPFEYVLVDHQNDRYVEAFEAVREKVAPGGVVVADNVLTATGQFDPADLLAAVEGDGEGTAGLRGVVEYARTVRADPDFETFAVPVGEGVLVSQRL